MWWFSLRSPRCRAAARSRCAIPATRSLLPTGPYLRRLLPAKAAFPVVSVATDKGAPSHAFPKGVGRVESGLQPANCGQQPRRLPASRLSAPDYTTHFPVRRYLQRCARESWSPTLGFEPCLVSLTDVRSRAVPQYRWIAQSVLRGITAV